MRVRVFCVMCIHIYELCSGFRVSDFLQGAYQARACTTPNRYYCERSLLKSPTNYCKSALLYCKRALLSASLRNAWAQAGRLKHGSDLEIVGVKRELANAQTQVCVCECVCVRACDPGGESRCGCCSRPCVCAEAGYTHTHWHTHTHMDTNIHKCVTCVGGAGAGVAAGSGRGAGGAAGKHPRGDGAAG